MIESKEIYEVRTDTIDLLASATNGELTFRGNVAYGKVLGVNVGIITYTENAGVKTLGGAYTGSGIKVGIRESGGSNRTLIAPIPYNLIKHSEDVEFTKRFIELNEVKGYGNDLKITIDTADESSANVRITATVLYSKA